MLVTLGGKTITGAIGSLITLAGWNTTPSQITPCISSSLSNSYLASIYTRGWREELRG